MRAAGVADEHRLLKDVGHVATDEVGERRCPGAAT